MTVKLTIEKGQVPVKVWTEDVEPGALQQLVNLSQLPIVHHHVAAMPDVHAGIGATVGSVIATKRAIIPAAVGVDIGCGMNAIRLPLTANELPDSLRDVRLAIERAVPVGFEMHAASKIRGTRHDHLARGLDGRLDRIVGKHPALMKMQRQFNETWRCQLGTLGGGNHFIEVCLDESQAVWVMVHSGSRGIGNVIGRYFIEAARKDLQRLQHNLPDRDLAYFSEGSKLFDDYVEAVEWAQNYAMVNRRHMLTLILDALRQELGVHGGPKIPSWNLEGGGQAEAISCHHNYVEQETHFGERVFVTRKGAISAKRGELGIIPGSMGAKSYIVRGLGNPESFCSCSHGAGRRMSRTAARRKFTELDLQIQTEGVECRKDGGVVDEIPGAYKDIDQVMDNQRDLVEVVHTLKQVVCVKG